MTKKAWQQKDKMVSLYDEYNSVRVVADKVGCSQPTAAYWLKVHGVVLNLCRGPLDSKLRNAGKPWASRKTLVRAYLRCGSKLLARKWGVNKSTVLNWLHRFNIPVRQATKHDVVYAAQREGMKKLRVATRATTGKLRRILDEAGVPMVCRKCGVDEESILHIDHKNGNRLDNRRANLQRLCPNCHERKSQRERGNRWAKPRTNRRP